MPRAVLDENVSLQVADRLKTLGYEVLAVAQHLARGMSNEAVFSPRDFSGHLVFLSRAGARIR